MPHFEDETGTRRVSAAVGDPTTTNRIEHLLSSAFKKRMGMEQLSERSGIIGVNDRAVDLRKYSYDVMLEKLERFKAKGKRTSLTRDNLIEFVA